MSKKKNKANVKQKEVVNEKEVKNGIANFTAGMINTNQLNKTDTMRNNNRYYYIFNDRQLLSSLYVEHGLIQTLIDQPVDDAFRGGFEIKSKQLDGDEIKELQQYLHTGNIIQSIMQTIKWGRLYGGAGLVLLTSQIPDKEFNIEKVNKYSSLEFYAADLWELGLKYYEQDPLTNDKDDAPYLFYGHVLHKSKVFDFKGKQAPSMIRRNFRGWGMSEVERMIRSFNQYLKNNNVIFDLLDEAKVDVYKLEGYNTSMLASNEQAIQDRVQLSNTLKSYLNALVMDKEDEYDQKNLSFSGLGDMLTEVRKGIASDLKMPMSKLFGESPSGLSNNDESGQENYNSLVEGEVRNKAKGLVLNVLRICSKKLFDIVVDDFEIEWKTLRILNSEQEQNVKNAKANRLMQLFGTGLVSVKEAKESINIDGLLGVDVEVTDDLNDDGVATNTDMFKEDL